MSHNTFGKMLRLTTWGESHGDAIGCVLDGCPPNIELSIDEIQSYLDKRKPGQSKYTTQRKEDDKIEILSGTIKSNSGNHLTTGTPISLLIKNKDQRSRDYGEINDKFRPGHADFTYIKKYGLRDYRGGGRSSARETAMRVAGGAIARKIIPDIKIRAALVQMGPHQIDRNNWDWDLVNKNPFFSPDPEIIDTWEKYLQKIRKDGDSTGAIIEVIAENVPSGLGEPIYGKLDQEIASGMMSINAVKAVEIGAGFKTASMTGSQNADQIVINEGNVEFLSNNAGGILGGISTGQDIIVRFAVKPTSSILKPVKTIDINEKETEISTRGRHDPCVGIRAVPIGEAMLALTLADNFIRNRGQIG
ncbi:MAG: chorismate synthase [Rhodobiaceae bacterium]|nr:chorismate synthase [Hyphomicrobiales bacterium]MAP06866.1 chorismate synthase [Rhodobiaceae bacterium]MBS70914.1 chorismate synthase [Rhodobiaceae bacterium]MEC8287380.1 chorismate synthase [Pseudomonadota bacterium]|tara:strand:- start:799 stop:1881 length:1083 start_codon:yes stop_codon:yes gene_type:complete